MSIKTLCTIIIIKMISVGLELSYRRVCTPMDSIYIFLLSMFSSSSEACGTIRTLSHNLDYLVMGLIMKMIGEIVVLVKM
jgi:hypothetical protein